MLTKGRTEGRVEGIAEGEKNKQCEIARNLKGLDMAMEDISQATGLTLEEIERS